VLRATKWQIHDCHATAGPGRGKTVVMADEKVPTLGPGPATLLGDHLADWISVEDSGIERCLTWGPCRVGDRRAARTHVSCSLIEPDMRISRIRSPIIFVRRLRRSPPDAHFATIRYKPTSFMKKAIPSFLAAHQQH